MKLVDIKIVLISILVVTLSHGVVWSMTIELGSEGIDFIRRGDQWQFFRGDELPSNLADAWQEIEFNDSGWERDESGFGYGDNDDETTLSDMRYNYWTVYIRKQFNVSPVPTGQILELLVDYDDGFVAYLNGNRVEYQHIRDEDVDDIDYQTPATSHEANHQTGLLDVFPLGLAEDFLNDGNNILAIEGHNADLDSTDFSLIPALRARSSAVKNDDTWIVPTNTVVLTVTTDAPSAVSVTIDGAPADYNSVDHTWAGQASLSPGLNTITVEALDAGANVVDSGSAQIVYVPPASHAAGELTEDTTWSDAVIVDETVVIPDGIVLTIEPGTVVLMNDGVSINVYGQLLANGTESEPIRFTHYGDGTAWKQIMFVEAADSRLDHCIIEYSACEGDHKDYYDDDCDDGTPMPSRVYHEAIVALATHLDIKGCTFQHLLGGGTNTEGDALAIISDDPEIPGIASANIRNCQFLSIGQGVHTRFSYVLIEGCYFTGKEGDNDDVDLYGESTPPPLVLNNLLLNPGHDDMINPTRCSAIMIGNVIGGSDDHGVVLRDKCSPVLLNNVIFDCSSAGIAVQNQCDALLINNTIFNCGRGIRFFDHTGRWGPPYCLFPGSGKATVVNCIVWDCTTTFELADSPYTGDLGSHVTIMHCDVEGGQSRMSVSANSTVTWLDGNINLDPLFADPGGGDFHLKSQAGRWNPAAESWITDGTTSPCIDAGTSYLIDDPKYKYSGWVDWRGEIWPHGKIINIGAYGGTPQASMSASPAGNAADCNNDGAVNGADLLLLAQMWLSDEALLHEDINRDSFVDLHDLARLGMSWGWHE